MMMQDINIFEELFLSNEIWGWFGPLGIIVIAFVILSNRKYKPLGVFFIIVESLLTYQYFTLAQDTSWYWWNALIMLFGVIICAFQMLDR